MWMVRRDKLLWMRMDRQDKLLRMRMDRQKMLLPVELAERQVKVDRMRTAAGDKPAKV